MEEKLDNEQGSIQSSGGENKTLVTVLIIVILLILVAVIFYLLIKNKKHESSSDTVSTAQNTVETDKKESAAKKSWQEGQVAIAGNYADADVVDLGSGQYRMYYSVEPEVKGNKLEMYSSLSSDGITWTKEEGERKTFATFPDAIKLPNGQWRIYFQNAGVIKSAISVDGLKLTDEPGTRIDSTEAGFSLENVAAPTTTRLEDGSYIMVYRGTIKQKYGTDTPNDSTQLFFYATSADGLTWQKKGLAVDSRNETLSGLADGPEWVKWDGSTSLAAGKSELRLYFWSYTGVYYVTYKDGSFSKASLDLPAAKDSFGKYPPNPPGDPTLAKIKDQWFMYYGQHTKGIYYSVFR